jgi:DNA polymerase III epsilon subunit-like protein
MREIVIDTETTGLDPLGNHGPSIMTMSAALAE